MAYIRLCPSKIPNGNLRSGCQRKGGSKCSYTCDLGYQSTIPSDYIICTSDFTWHENIEELCRRISCPLEIPNGNFSSHCRGNIGDKCEIVCQEGFNAEPRYIVCTSSGSWDKDIHAVCVRSTEIRCPLEIPNGNFSLLCQGSVGEKCKVDCHGQLKTNSLHLVCTSSGEWDKDTDRICVQNSYRNRKFHSADRHIWKP
ncbi:P-selectin-like [Saccostrea echinata]|uniref:P-selectin-like n=1 Tax=Saccostrea echinata TaxID=191078 RepID=UPI002A812431|nr:P-selectin-like [Saccostrea echinata]